jgi:hypothetical protein
MQVNGYMIREAIKQWETRRDALQAQFPDTLTKFPDDPTPSPKDVASQLLEAEANLAKIQQAQAQYNAAVKIPFKGTPIPLGQAVKMLGGLARLEKLWKDASHAPKRNPWDTDSKGPRDPNLIHAVRQVSYLEAADLAVAAGKDSGNLKVEVASANATAIELDLDSALLG